MTGNMRVMYVIDFDSRDDGGPMLVGPFGTRSAADRWMDRNGPADCEWGIRPMHVPDLTERAPVRLR